MYGFRLVHISFNVITVRKLNAKTDDSARKYVKKEAKLTASDGA